MFVFTNRLKTLKGRGDELEKLFLSSDGLEQQEGFLGFELWKMEASADHDEHLVITRWESKEAHHRWTRSETHKQAHTQANAGSRPDFLVGHPEFGAYEVRSSSCPGEEKA